MSYQTGKILIVDDDAAMRRLFSTLLSPLYEVQVADNGNQAVKLVEMWTPDIVLLDIVMPGLSGYETLQQINAMPCLPPQIIMVSGKSEIAEQAYAFECGADDYLIKPVDPAELRSRVQLHFRYRESQAVTSALQNEVNSHHAALKQASQERMEQVVAVQDVAVRALAKVAESRDNETGQHIARISEFAHRLAIEIRDNELSEEQIDDTFLADLQRSAPLHDIGKVGIPDSILLKPARLSEDEFEVMKRHSEIGAKILGDLVIETQHAGFLKMAARIARFHHERWDGNGYPVGISGKQIPLPARIVAVADVYDALTSERPYKDAWSPELARQTILEGSGTQFDPMVVDAFLRCFDDFLKIQIRRSDNGELVETAISLLEESALEAW